MKEKTMVRTEHWNFLLAHVLAIFCAPSHHGADRLSEVSALCTVAPVQL